jgi:hypothetical protein
MGEALSRIYHGSSPNLQLGCRRKGDVEWIGLSQIEDSRRIPAVVISLVMVYIRTIRNEGKVY